MIDKYRCIEYFIDAVLLSEYSISKPTYLIIL